MKFINAEILWPTGLQQGEISISGEIVSDTCSGSEIDASGFKIVPGIIDLHGDAFDRHLAARRGAVQEIDRGYWALDAEFGANGISTAVLAQFYSWEGGMRGPAFCERMMAGLRSGEHNLTTDMKLQMRLEVSMVDDFEHALSLIDRFDVSYVVFNDHLPREALRAGKKPPRLTGTALKSGRSPETHLNLMYKMLENEPREAAALEAFVQQLNSRGIVVGSHDDREPDIRTAYRDLGVRIAEFPETAETAAAAIDAGDPVIVGAPNVVRGASHNGNASGRDLVARGLVTALVSDYHYPSLISSARCLVNEGLCSLEEAWHLLSGGPASILNLTDRGTLERGKRADMVILEGQSLRVAGTLVAGRFSFLTGELADRVVRGQ
ncbi:MAG: alpha-D-ribose 1-methylphosphonate 5-triphosphate diphosphatase [Pseudomonadota bacterium]